MCIFMFNFHEKEIINEKENLIKDDIIKHSKSIFKYLMKLMNCDCFNGLYIFLVCHHIKEYDAKYDLWKRVDKLFLIKELYDQYFKYEKFLKETKNIKHEIKENSLHMQSKILGKIMSLTKNDGFKLNEQLN